MSAEAQSLDVRCVIVCLRWGCWSFHHICPFNVLQTAGRPRDIMLKAKRSSQPASNTKHSASTWVPTQTSKWGNITVKHILRAHNRTVIVQGWLWNTCTVETGNRTNKPLFMHQASHNKVSIIPCCFGADSVERTTGRDETTKCLSQCRVLCHGLIAHLIQADVVSLSQHSVWIMKHYQLREQVKIFPQSVSESFADSCY